jgi:hypothetical protein
VTIEHVARIPVRNQQIVAFGRHYSVTVHTCQPRDPASKGGVENAVKLAKADIVPTDTNLGEQYESFAALQDACTAFMTKVNHRVHSTTKRVPADMLTVEQQQLHPIPETAHTITFGETRQIAVNTPMVAYQGGSYSGPHLLLGEPVWVRTHGVGGGERIVIVHVGPAGPVEVARHRRAEPGSPQIDDAHFPPAPEGALHREPRPGTPAETAFLQLGEGAVLWLKEAAAQGTSRIRIKMEHAVSIAKLTGVARVDWALGHAAVHQRFGEGDLASILAAHLDPTAVPARRAGEQQSLTQGTAGWAALGTTNTNGAGGTAAGETVSGAATVNFHDQQEDI